MDDELKDAISNEKMGFRDVYWCFILNEPMIIAYDENDKPYCPHCCGFDAHDHTFQFHINKPLKR